MDSKKTPFDVISFSSAGMMCVYQLGVCARLQEHSVSKPNDSFVHPRLRILGTSSGAAVGAAMLCGYSAFACAEEFIPQVDRITSNVMCMIPTFTNVIHKLCPENAAEKCNRRLFVACSRINVGKNWLSPYFIHQFQDRKELLDVLCASAHLPILSGIVPRFLFSQLLYDGMLTHPHPRTSLVYPSSSENALRTLYITWWKHCGCGCGTSDSDITIKPSVLLPGHWCLCPPPPYVCRLIFLLGYFNAHATFFPPITTNQPYTQNHPVCSDEWMKDFFQHTPVSLYTIQYLLLQYGDSRTLTRQIENLIVQYKDTTLSMRNMFYSICVSYLLDWRMVVVLFMYIIYRIIPI